MSRNSSFVYGIMDTIQVYIDDETAYHVGEAIEARVDKLLIMTWSVADVQSCIRANERLMNDNPDLVNDMEFLQAVLDFVQNSFDANIGINWNVIDNAIQQIVWERRND